MIFHDGFKLLICTALTICMSLAVVGNISAKEGKKYEKSPRGHMEYLADLNMPIEFYGQVLDLEGRPVPEADVTMRLSFAPPTPLMKNQKLVKTTTDQTGRFTFRKTGYQLYLVEVEKEGYQYHYKYNPNRGFRFHKGEKKAELGQLEDQPAIFKVRKKGEPTLVLTNGASFQFRPGPSSVRYFDLLRQSWTYPKLLKTEKINFKDWHEHLRISLSKEADTYHLLFEGLDEGTGLVMGKPEQYMAPETGYQPTLDLAIPQDEKETERWLFLEGRGGEFYTMLKVKTAPTKKWLNLNVWYGTNPVGSRNLERSPELEMEYIKKKYGRK